MNVNEYVYKIALSTSVRAKLNLEGKTYLAETEACDVVRKACETTGWKFTKATEDNCTVFRNEHGAEIVRVVPVNGPH
jgi:hypothetical protein